MARVSKDKKLEVCDWIAEHAEHRQVELPEGASAQLAHDLAVLATIEGAVEEFGYRAPTIRKWYEELINDKKPLQEGDRPKPRRGRPRKTRQAAQPAAGAGLPAGDEELLAEALIMIGEQVLGQEEHDEAGRRVLLSLGRLTLEKRLKDREIRALREQLEG